MGETQQVEFDAAFGFADEFEGQGAGGVAVASDAPVGVVVADDAREVEFEFGREFEVEQDVVIGVQAQFDKARFNVGIHLDDIVQAFVGGGDQFFLRVFLFGREQVVQVVTPVGGVGVHGEVDALGDVVGQGVFDFGDEQPGEAFGVGENVLFLAVAQAFENLVQGWAGQAGFPSGALNQVGDGVTLGGGERAAFEHFLTHFGLET